MTLQVVRNCFGTPIPKFHILMLLFNLAHPKMDQKNLVYKHFLSLRPGGCLLQVYQKLKIKRKYQNCFPLTRSKTNFSHFGGPENIFKNIFISNVITLSAANCSVRFLQLQKVLFHSTLVVKVTVRAHCSNTNCQERVGADLILGTHGAGKEYSSII